MEQVYLYRAKFSWGYLFMGLIGIIMIVFPFFIPLTLKLKSLVLLEPPASSYVIQALGVLFVIACAYEFLQNRVINKLPEPIKLSDEGMTCYDAGVLGAKKVYFTYPQVKKIWEKSDDDDGESLILYVGEQEDRHEFFETNFENEEKFQSFKQILLSRCQNLVKE